MWKNEVLDVIYFSYSSSGLWMSSLLLLWVSKATLCYFGSYSFLHWVGKFLSVFPSFVLRYKKFFVFFFQRTCTLLHSFVHKVPKFLSPLPSFTLRYEEFFFFQGTCTLFLIFCQSLILTRFEPCFGCWMSFGHYLRMRIIWCDKIKKHQISVSWWKLTRVLIIEFEHLWHCLCGCSYILNSDVICKSRIRNFIVNFKSCYFLLTVFCFLRI